MAGGSFNFTNKRTLVFSMQKRLLFLILLSIFSFSIGSGALAWGPEAHYLITKHAIQLLPIEIKGFYSANTRYLAAMSVLPDDWRQTYKETGYHHYCDLDMFFKPPFSELRAEREVIEPRIGQENLKKMGILPWIVKERYDKLVSAFKSGNSEEIVLQSAILAHFIGDAHVPFHTTKDWDGRGDEQKGLHARWEDILFLTWCKPEMVNPSSPAPVKNILESIFDWLTESYNAVEPIIAAEAKAISVDPNHSYKYYETMWNETGNIQVSRIKTACESLAGAYISAWKEAGQPTIEQKPAPLFWGR